VDRQADDEAIFASLYPALYRLAAAIRPAHVEAADLVQEALVRALATRSLHEFENLPGYLRATVVHLAANHKRSFTARTRASRRLTAEADLPPRYPSDLEDLMRVAPVDRAVLYLRFVEDCSFQEIAETLGTTEQAARARSSRALRKLRIDLHEELRHGPA
jgi:DNA-directed RNA polymerase specialized sigma24 family protein